MLVEILGKDSLHKSAKRLERGMSLIYVVIVGGIAASAALAVGAALFPAYTSVSTMSQHDKAVSASENTVKYILARLNTTGQDKPIQDLTIEELAIPSSVKGDATVTAQLSPINIGLIKDAGLYHDFNVNNPEYKVLQVSSKVGGANYTIQVVLEPQYFRFSPHISTGQDNDTTKLPGTPIFTRAMQADNNLTIGDGIAVTMKDGTNLGADIGSNNQIVLRGNATINGDVVAYTPANSNGGATTSIQASSATTVMGNVSSAGNIANLDPSNTAIPLKSDAFGGNVYGDGINGPTPVAGEIKTASAPTQIVVAETPFSAAYAAVETTSVSSQNISSPNGATASNLGNLVIKAGDTVSIKPGNYIVDSVIIQNGGSLKIDVSGVNETPGVNFYVQGKGASQTPINVEGQITFDGQAAPAANNLQFFYNGTKSVNFTLSNPSSSLYGLIYAPKASVGINFANLSKFTGAVVGKNLSVSALTTNSKGSFVFDPMATSNAPNSSTIAAAPSYTQKNGNEASPVFGYNVISWKEGLP